MRSPELSDTLQLLEKLVALPTIAGQPNRSLIEFARDWLQTCGAHVTVVPSPSRPDGYNLHAVFGPGHDNGGFLRAAHTDVVGVDGQAWSGDPFKLRPHQ